jgi:hypothetical protein
LGFCILILLAGSCDIEIPVGLLCFLVGLCGIASGVMQSGPRRFELVDAFLGHFEREVYCPVCGELSGSMKLGIKCTRIPGFNEPAQPILQYMHRPAVWLQ